MQDTPLISDLLARMADMANKVHDALLGGSIKWKWKPESDEWSLTQIVCHLRDVEREVHQARFKLIIAEENVFLSGVSADDWAEARDYQNQDGPAALEAYLMARDETMSILNELDSEMWQRKGRHAFFGETTMHELLFLATRHDNIHWEQIKGVLSSQ